MKPLFYSEALNRTFDTEASCLKAEADYEKAQKEKAEKAKRLQSDRKVAAEQVKQAFIKYREDYKDYLKLRNEFVDKYGSFHMSITEKEDPDFTFLGLDELLNRLC